MISPDLKAVAENPELVARMVEFVRDVSHNCVVTSDQTRRFWNEASAIVADLPKPIDPDLIEARKVARDEAIRNGQRAQAAEYESGKWDNGSTILGILAGIKRGRLLSERSRTEAERG